MAAELKIITLWSLTENICDVGKDSRWAKAVEKSFVRKPYPNRENYGRSLI